eukprot:Gregarina_sp_Poly_1__1736@NODE_1447_length_4129_cov_139_623584_g959_i0_p2_GENE_NODE_1447_length_4129_cov_139_623584_g959_i0NODE_1447_length_4129_cov_139_623584_g959_i0_p2_ORF_typecomplete_len306_score41_79Brix/PF04427_18/5_6e37_NODE_1447_length_4129_cov_139_623584_g959_i023873304
MVKSAETEKVKFGAETEEDYTETLDDDPYLLKERKHEELAPSLKWTNKQRTLLFATRGINALHRHLLEDLKKLLPHHKSESKWEKSQGFDMIPELAEVSNCNNIILFEARKQTDLYMWMVRSPAGPSVKFSVLNIHNSGETSFLGNHLLYSRPLLVFDSHFHEHPALRLLRELFVQIWGTPRNHPKAKPFHDHTLSFHWSDSKIWIRHFQIFSEKFSSRVDDQTLIEVGPRITLNPIRIFDGAFGGKTLWKNAHYVSPTALRLIARKRMGSLKFVQAMKKANSQRKRDDRGHSVPEKLENLFRKA